MLREKIISITNTNPNNFFIEITPFNGVVGLWLPYILVEMMVSQLKLHSRQGVLKIWGAEQKVDRMDCIICVLIVKTRNYGEKAR